MSCETLENRDGIVTMKGDPLTLVGPEIKVGDKAPNFRVVDGSLKDVTLDAYEGETLLIVAVPSLDTSVCDTEARRFNEAATKLPGVRVLVISVDLPFAQQRWCGAAGVENVVTLSDYQSGSFGKAYGIMIKGLRLLSRAVFVVKDGKVTYVEIVPEVTSEPDYDAALAAL